jgi:hypothetical protein
MENDMVSTFDVYVKTGVYLRNASEIDDIKTATNVTCDHIKKYFNNEPISISTRDGDMGYESIIELEFALLGIDIKDAFIKAFDRIMMYCGSEPSKFHINEHVYRENNTIKEINLTCDIDDGNSCWKCRNKDVKFASQNINCHIKKMIVYPWTAQECKDYEQICIDFDKCRDFDKT